MLAMDFERIFAFMLSYFGEIICPVYGFVGFTICEEFVDYHGFIGEIIQSIR